MRAKTLLELVSLSANIYLLTKDKQLMETLSEMADKGKEKVNKMMDDWKTEDGEEGEEGEKHRLLDKLMEKAREAKAEFEEKMENVAKTVYAKMKIAHAEEIEKLQKEISGLRHEVSHAETRIVALEGKMPQ
jgi:polyhydroxyalkanoate synthesis regulator phasin